MPSFKMIPESLDPAVFDVVSTYQHRENSRGYIARWLPWTRCLLKPVHREALVGTSACAETLNRYDPYFRPRTAPLHIDGTFSTGHKDAELNLLATNCGPLFAACIVDISDELVGRISDHYGADIDCQVGDSVRYLIDLCMPHTGPNWAKKLAEGNIPQQLEDELAGTFVTNYHERQARPGELATGLRSQTLHCSTLFVPPMLTRRVIIRSFLSLE